MTIFDPATPPPSDEPPVIDHRPEPVAAAVPEVRYRGGTPLALTLLMVVALAGGIYWTWTHPMEVTPAVQPADPQAAIDAAKAGLAAQIEAQAQTVAQQLQALTARVDALEKQHATPAPESASPANPGANADVAADLAKKLDDVAGQVTALAAKQSEQAADLQKLGDLAAQRPTDTPPPPDHSAQDAAAAMEQQRLADLGGKLDTSLAQEKEAVAQEKQALEQQKAALDEQKQVMAQAQAEAAKTDAAQRAALQALQARLDKLEQGAGQIQGAAQDATRAIKLQAAQAALLAGQPLGEIPGAPPALTRFATVAPPTDAALRGAFPPGVAAARAASRPDLDRESFFQRMASRLQQSVTVRQGDHVLVGDPAAGILAHAQTDVDNDDLKGAVGVLSGLNGGAAAAVEPWVTQVEQLLAARDALAALAAHG
jgi:hypothetical protein